MALPHKETYITPEQYLEIQRTAELPSEYIDGEMIAMSGAAKAHGMIVINLGSEIRTLMRGRSCVASTGISVSAPASYLIPDLVVYCDGGDFASDEEILRNPIVIVEILSNSTSGYDHGRKWMRYQKIASLMHYVLISQYEPNIEVFSRDEGDKWQYEDLTGLDASLRLSHLGIDIALADIYEGVSFSAQPIE